MTHGRYLVFLIAFAGDCLCQSLDSIEQTFADSSKSRSVAISVAGSVSASAITRSGGNWLSVARTGTSGSYLVTLDPAGLPDGTYLGTLTFTPPSPRSTVPVVMKVGDPGPQLTQTGVVNAASYQGGAVPPGEIVTLFGAAIGPKIPYSGKILSRALHTKIAATKVWFDGVAAPLVYVSRDQLAAVVPFEIHGKSSVTVQVENLVARTPPLVLPVVEAKPAVFTADASGRGPAAALNQDGTLNTSMNPAEKGSFIVLYATGAGMLTPEIATGTLADALPLPVPRLPIRLLIAGQQAEVMYAGQAPGLVAGAIQINARIPNSASGASSVVLVAGSTQSQIGVTIHVR